MRMACKRCDGRVGLPAHHLGAIAAKIGINPMVATPAQCWCRNRGSQQSRDGSHVGVSALDVVFEQLACGVARQVIVAHMHLLGHFVGREVGRDMGLHLSR